jgi:HK97 family phage prohead protease
MPELRAAGDPPAVIADIDGTLIAFDGTPRRSVIDWANGADGRLVVVTGRTDDERDATEAELDAAGVRARLLYMKPGDDVDTVAFKYAVAEDLLREWDVRLAVDDDAACRAEYARLGIDAVAPGDLPDDEDDDGGEYRQVDTTPPQYVRDAAARGLELRADGFGGDGLAPSTIREARAMARGDVSEDKAVRAAAWAARHAVDLDATKNSDPDDPEWPGPGAVAHYLWGIDPLDPGPARAWFERTAADIKDEEGRMTTDTATIAPELRAALDRTREVRAFAKFDEVEERAAAGDVVFRGYASVFDSPYDIAGVFAETVRRGAFTRTLAQRDWRIHLLVNHDESSIPLASVESGTMQLWEDERGLRVEAALDPSSPWAQSVISAVRRGDLAEMSFAFSVVRDRWNDDQSERELLEVRLYEVSVVRNGANPATRAELASAVTVPDEAPAKNAEHVADELELRLRLLTRAA